jgi:hypothetical protein
MYRLTTHDGSKNISSLMTIGEAFAYIDGMHAGVYAAWKVA